MIEINGMAHVTLTVSDWDRCRPFYERLLAFLGLTRVFAGDDFIYFVGGRTALGVHRAAPAVAGQRFVQGSVGLHHLCFRCRSREDVDKVHAFLVAEQATIVRAPEPGPWAPGYYSVLFEDPVGIRLEVNHVPGQGVLAEGVGFNPAADYT
jgi:catechol 2,3-dioxygenase-like lactoylglutathione lyase family enzyme